LMYCGKERQVRSMWMKSWTWLRLKFASRNFRYAMNF